MGLFGYGKGEYKKYSMYFEIKLGDIVRMSEIMRLTLVPDGETLKAAIGKERIPQKSEFKSLEAIDTRIKDVIDKLMAATNSGAAFSHRAYAAILYSLLAENRAKGTVPEDFDVNFEDRFAECGAEIEMLIAERDRLATRLKDVTAALSKNENDPVSKAYAADAMNQFVMVIGKLAPYLGQINEFSDTLSLGSHTFGKVSAKAEDITLDDLLGILTPERERLDKAN